MPDDEYKRLRKLVARLGVALFVVLIALTFWASYEIKNLKNTIALQSSRLTSLQQQPQLVVHDGKDGVSIIGPAGQSGRDGKNGLNGSGVTAGQIAQAVGDYLRLNPVEAVKGDSGLNGLPGKQIELQFADGHLEFKYVGDEIWQIVEGQL